MRRALCVGIDKYRFGALGGCVSDAGRMAALLAKHEEGTPNFECRELVAPIGEGDDLVTRDSLRTAIEYLFRDDSEMALLHFSGHGTENNLDGYLATQDATRYDEGVAIGDILTLANQSGAGEVVIILDCCSSGHLGQPPGISNDKVILRKGISVLSASSGDRRSLTGSGGHFTSLVAEALAGGAANLTGEVTTSAVYASVEAALGACNQRPLFKAHVSKMIALRRCKPPIDTAVLRDLPALFPEPTEDFRLSCEFEGAVKTATTFAKLHALSRVQLVTLVDERHSGMAIRSKSCRLTAAGRYYWRLAKHNRI